MIRAVESLSLDRRLDSSLLAAVHPFVIGDAMIVVTGRCGKSCKGHLHSFRVGDVQYALICSAPSLPLGSLVHMWRIAAVGGLLAILVDRFSFTLQAMKRRAEVRSGFRFA